MAAVEGAAEASMEAVAFVAEADFTAAVSAAADIIVAAMAAVFIIMAPGAGALD
jgi:hypothetical protein